MSNSSENSRPVIQWEYANRPYRYVVTPTDEAWFIRCLWREGKPQEAVGFTLLQRFAALYSRNKPYSTLSDFLRAYCQPINPRWLPGGDLSEARIKRLEAQGNKTKAELERNRAKKRAEYVSTPIAKIPTKYKKISTEILAGKLQSPIPKATHFTSSFATAGDTEARAKAKGEKFATAQNLKLVEIPEGYKLGYNWFFSGPNDITPPKINFSSAAWSSGFFFALTGLAVLFFAWQRQKKLTIEQQSLNL